MLLRRHIDSTRAYMQSRGNSRRKDWEQHFAGQMCALGLLAAPGAHLATSKIKSPHFLLPIGLGLQALSSLAGCYPGTPQDLRGLYPGASALHQ